MWREYREAEGTRPCECGETKGRRLKAQEILRGGCGSIQVQGSQGKEGVG